MNRKRLVKLREWLLAHPSRFVYYTYWDNQDDKEYETPQAEHDAMTCNTVGCVAGWACHLFAPNDISFVPWGKRGKQVLALSCSQQYILFYYNVDDADVSHAIDRIDFLLAVDDSKTQYLSADGIEDMYTTWRRETGRADEPCA
jgi:hypothetical protein